jgi:hypothetical protein
MPECNGNPDISDHRVPNFIFRNDGMQGRSLKAAATMNVRLLRPYRPRESLFVSFLSRILELHGARNQLVHSNGPVCIGNRVLPIISGSPKVRDVGLFH